MINLILKEIKKRKRSSRWKRKKGKRRRSRRRIRIRRRRRNRNEIIKMSSGFFKKKSKTKNSIRSG